MGEEKRKKEGGVFILPIWNEGKKKDPKRQRKMEKCADEKEKERGKKEKNKKEKQRKIEKSLFPDRILRSRFCSVISKQVLLN